MEARRLADRVVVVDGGANCRWVRRPRCLASHATPGWRNWWAFKIYSRAVFTGLAEGLGPAALAVCRAGKRGCRVGRRRGRCCDAVHLWFAHPTRAYRRRVAQVRWVWPVLEVQRVHPWWADAAGSGDDPHANLLECVVEEVLALGETSLCTLRPMGLAAERITLTQSTVQLRALGILVGGRALLHIAPGHPHHAGARMTRRPQFIFIRLPLFSRLRYGEPSTSLYGSHLRWPSVHYWNPWERI